MARKPKPRLNLKDPKNAMVVKLAEQVRTEVRKRYGTELTYGSTEPRSGIRAKSSRPRHRAQPGLERLGEVLAAG
jgi:hypothetical protein